MTTPAHNGAPLSLATLLEIAPDAEPGSVDYNQTALLRFAERARAQISAGANPEKVKAIMANSVAALFTEAAT